MDPVRELVSQFGSLLGNPKYSDVVLCVGECKIPANRCVLAARSPVFGKMLYGSMQEASSPLVEVVELMSRNLLLKIQDPLVTPEVFQQFLKFLYTGFTEISPYNVFHLLYLAKCYQLLMQLCNSKAVEMINDEDVLVLWSSAILLDETELIGYCKKHICERTCRVIERTPVRLVDKTALLELLKCGELTVDEIKLFVFVRDWITEHSPPKELEEEILSHIRFPMISPADLLHVVKPSNLAPTAAYVEAFEFQTDSSVFDTTQLRFKPRCDMRTGKFGRAESAQISSDGRVAMSTKTQPNYVLGESIFSHGVIEWTMQINFMREWVFFGIINPRDCLRSRSFDCASSFGWGKMSQVFIGGEMKYLHGGYSGDFRSGDIVRLTLNCDKKKLTFKTDRTSQSWILDLPCQGPWTLHVNMCGPRESISILHYLIR